MTDNLLSRRRFLHRSLEFSACVLVMPFLVACSDRRQGGKEDGSASASVLDCSDTTGLSTSERSLRQSLEYVDLSPHVDQQHCGNCYFFTASGANACGRCATVQGPISPQGYCIAWNARTF